MKMKNSLAITLVVSLAVVVCTWLVRFDLAFELPQEHGVYSFRFSFRK